MTKENNIQMDERQEYENNTGKENGMKLEVLVSTMFKDGVALANQMNIRTDSVIINQCDEEHDIVHDRNHLKTHVISYKGRGLSESRNKAIDASKADICIIADDDLTYEDDYSEIIQSAYLKYPDADIIAFDVPSVTADRMRPSLPKGKVNFLSVMKIASYQLTFKRASLVNSKIRFNEKFGAGSTFTCGEENILMSECLKAGMKIYFVNKNIATVDHGESTWYNGFDEKLFVTKGAMFYKMNRILFLPLIAQFAIRKHGRYKNEMSMFKAFKLMLEGKNKYKSLNFGN